MNRETEKIISKPFSNGTDENGKSLRFFILVGHAKTGRRAA